MYRERVDPQARQWLEQGKAERDPRLLRRLVDETFCSRFTDQAIDLLGDLAFERGNFEEASDWWNMLAPLSPSEPQGLASGFPSDHEKSLRLNYANPQVDLARVRAKQILVRLFQGERTGLPVALKDFRAKNGRSEGAFAGRKGNYADILEALAADPKLTAEVDKRKNEPRPWPTFAGDSTRSFVSASAPRRLALESPPWPIRLDDKPAGENESLAGRRLLKPSPGPGGPGFDLDFYPVIAGDLVLVANAYSVTAYDLITGQIKGRFDLQEDLKGLNSAQLDLRAAEKGASGFTVTVSDNRVYARLGTMQLLEIPSADKRSGKRQSFLVCLDLAPKDGKLIPRWFHSSSNLDPEGRQTGALFEGTPAVREGRAFAARTHLDKMQSATEIDCFDAETGKLRWRQEVCIAAEGVTGEPRQRHHLITLAGDKVVYCSHSGAVIALDERTGKRAWAVRYPSRGMSTENGAASPRDLAPCLYAAGRIFVAPADFGGILCLDASTGQKIWEKGRVEVVHLLGVAKGRLIFTTEGRRTGEANLRSGIQGLDAGTGKESRKWIQPEDGERSSFGRGFLAGDFVFWPTQPSPHQPRLPSLRVLNQDDGQPPLEIDAEQYWQIQPGNMAYGNGCLAVADQERLYVYVPPGRLLEERRKEAAARTDSAPACYRLAVAEADAGLAAQALNDFARAEGLAKKDEQWNGFPLRELARCERHRLLLDLARREWAADRSPQAGGYLEKATAPEFSTSERLRALRRKAEWLVEAKSPERAVAVWQGILDDAVLRTGQMLDAQGHPQQASAYAADQIGDLIKTYGRGIYEGIEQRACSELSSTSEYSEALDQLGRRFPNASIIRSALPQDAAAQEKAGRSALAAQEYRCLLIAKEGDRAETTAREGLARIGHRFEDLRSVQSQPDFKRPLAPCWEALLSADECLLEPQSSGSTRLFFADGSYLIGREICQNTPCWKRPLAGFPCWVSSHADMIVVGGRQSIHCFRFSDGRELWKFADPNLPAAARLGAGGEADYYSFSQFHLSGGLLFFLQGNRRLLAIDVDSGRVLWTRSAPSALIRPAPPSGEFVRHFYADSNYVVIQTSGGRGLILESSTGREILPIQSDGELWQQPPLMVGERQLCLVAGSRRIASVDLSTGRELWKIQTPLPGTTALPPQLLANDKTLLNLVDGWQLARLEPLSGEVLWECPAGTEPLLAEHLALDSERLYYVSRNILYTRTLSDGRALWSLELPKQSVSWKIVVVGDYLLVFPSQAPYQLRWGIFLGSNPMSFPLEIRWNSFPVLVCDKKSAKVIHRLDLSGRGPQLAVHCFAKGLAVVQREKIVVYVVNERPQNGKERKHQSTKAPKGK
jgi:outer membrane protein assembly factor BamB